ncbi:MAG: CSLREA domain-containing protein [Candidatus Promineifilaceae bacterium]
MFKKATRTILSILCLTIAILASTRPTFANGTNTIVVNTLDDTRHWEGNCSLRDAINSANSDHAQDGCKAGVSGLDTIIFAHNLQGGTVALTGEQLPIHSDMTIRGNVTINAQYRSRIFLLGNNNTVTLENLTLIHGKARFGGGIGVLGSDLTLKNVTMDRNQATHSGGAISYGSLVGRLNIISSNFSRNTATVNGAAIRNYESDVNIYDSVFTNNFAGEKGGALFNDGGTVTSSATAYTQNAADEGGAIAHEDGRLTLNGDTFTRNYGRHSGAGLYLLGYNIRILNSFFEANTSRDVGGAISANTASARISNTGFQDNVALSGGAIYSWDATLDIDHTVFNRNRGRLGGAIYHTEDRGIITLNTVILQSNRANEGGAIHNTGKMRITDSTLVDNHAILGGAIYNTVGFRRASQIIIENSTLDFNEAFSGAAIMNITPEQVMGTGHIEISNSQLANNIGENGPALFNQDAFATLTANNIMDNEGNAINNATGNVKLFSNNLHGNQFSNCVGSITLDSTLPNQDSDGSCAP